VPPTGKGGRAASHKADSIWLTNGQVFCGWLTAHSWRRNFDSSHRSRAVKLSRWPAVRPDGSLRPMIQRRPRYPRPSSREQLCSGMIFLDRTKCDPVCQYNVRALPAATQTPSGQSDADPARFREDAE
jgi:hypothetical protein